MLTKTQESSYQQMVSRNGKGQDKLAVGKNNSYHQYAQTISRSSNLKDHLVNHIPQLHSGGTMRAQSFQNPSMHYYYNGSRATSQDYTGNQHYMATMKYHTRGQLPYESITSIIDKHALLNKPLCRCRVMYLGSAVPHVTKNGLHGIQEPLKHLYPDEQFSASKSIGSVSQSSTATINEGSTNGLGKNTIDISHLSSSLGIDSWLSVWSNGLLLENIDEFGREVKRFFSIESLHYCAAVRFFDTNTLISERESASANKSSGELNNNHNNCEDSTKQHQDPNQLNGEMDIQRRVQSPIQETIATAQRSPLKKKSMVRFLPLDAPLFQCPGMIDANHPPVFASIMRRTSGIKVLECHSFICRRDAAANALVRCCTHAYADFLNAKRLSVELGASLPMGASVYANGQYVDANLRRSSKSSRHRNKFNTLATSNRNIINSTNSFSTVNTTSNDENSPEVSSEDNYAIITKSSGAQLQSQRSNGIPKERNRKLGDDDNNNNNLSSSDSSSKRKESAKSDARRHSNKSKGSSRSLYDDFMPKSTSRCLEFKNNKHIEDLEKLSHSLDQIQIASCCKETEAAKSDFDDGYIYSMVTTKRHSKSMQNLEGPFQFTAPTTAMNSKSSNRSSRSRSRSIRKREQQHRDSDSKSCHRKATSYQDMLALRKNSMNSDILAHRSAASKVDISPDVDRNLQQVTPLNRVYVPSDSEMITIETGFHTGTPSSKVKSVKKSSSHRREQSCPPRCKRRADLERTYDSVVVAGQPNVLPMGPGKAAHYYQPQQHPHMTYSKHPVPMYSSHHPVYMPYYVPQNPQFPPQHTIYAPPQGGPCPMYDQALGPYIGQVPPPQLMNPYVQPNSISDPYHTAARMHLESQLASNTLMPTRSKSSKSNLARFRCLSPPVNFLGSSDTQGPDDETQVQTVKRDSVHSKIDDSQTIESASRPESSEILPANGSEIVSAMPSFIASSNTLARKKKMGWIKRLSLTMSASGDDSDAGTLSTNPNGTPAGQKKKRAGFFSGSLTLGRNKQQQARLISQPT